MKLNAYNSTIAESVIAAITAVEEGTISLGDAQSVLQGAIPRFEDDGSGITDAVRLAEADLEEIQFTTLLDEQLPAAIFRLDELRAAIEDMSEE